MGKKVIVFASVLIAGMPGVAAETTTLSFEKVRHAQVSIVADIHGVVRYGNTLYTFPFSTDFVIETKYNPDASSDSLAFGDGKGETSSSQRRPLPKEIGEGFWNTLLPLSEENFLLFDGDRLMTAVVTRKDLAYVNKNSVIYDLIRPAADPRGEPTAAETKRFRAKFARSMVKQKRPRLVFAGLAPFGESAGSMLAVTRLKDSPLVTITCDEDSPGRCLVDRACNLELSVKQPKNGWEFSGIAKGKGAQTYFLADRGSHAIYQIHFDSCWHVSHSHTFRLPERIGRVRGIFVDMDENLWVSTSEIDQYRNASVYLWSRNDWLGPDPK